MHDTFGSKLFYFYLSVTLQLHVYEYCQEKIRRSQNHFRRSRLGLDNPAEKWNYASIRVFVYCDRINALVELIEYKWRKRGSRTGRVAAPILSSSPLSFPELTVIWSVIIGLRKPLSRILCMSIHVSHTAK